MGGISVHSLGESTRGTLSIVGSIPPQPSAQTGSLISPAGADMLGPVLWTQLTCLRSLLVSGMPSRPPGLQAVLAGPASAQWTRGPCPAVMKLGLHHDSPPAAVSLHGENLGSAGQHTRTSQSHERGCGTPQRCGRRETG